MIFTFNDFQEDNIKITVQLGNQIIQELELPMIFAQHQFISFAEEAAQDDRPMQIKCLRKDYSESGKELENTLIFSNNAYIQAFREET